jgi:hypothetical protein
MAMENRSANPYVDHQDFCAIAMPIVLRAIMQLCANANKVFISMAKLARKLSAIATISVTATKCAKIIIAKWCAYWRMDDVAAMRCAWARIMKPVS